METVQTLTPRPQSPSTGLSPRATLSSAQLRELFNNATSTEACAEAAKAFAENRGACPPGVLFEWLCGLPAEVPLVPLCKQLAHELAATGASDTATWTELLQAVHRAHSADGPRATPQEALTLLQGCAWSLASVKVSGIDVWNKLIEAVPGSVQGAPRLQAMAGIAHCMMLAGVEQEAPWKSLIATAVQAPFDSLPHAAFAKALRQAGVGHAPAWRLLRDDMEASHRVTRGDRFSFYNLLFSAEPAPLDLSILMRQLGAAALLSNYQNRDPAIWKRLFDAGVQCGALAQVVKACIDNVCSPSVWSDLRLAIETALSIDGFAAEPVYGALKELKGTWAGSQLMKGPEWDHLWDALLDRVVSEALQRGPKALLDAAEGFLANKDIKRFELVLNLVLDASMQCDADDWVRVARMITSSKSSMSEDIGIWKRVIHGAEQGGVRALSTLVHICEHIPSLEFWRDLFSAMDSASSGDALALLPVLSKTVAQAKDRYSDAADVLVHMLRRVLEAARDASERDRQLVIASVKEHLAVKDFEKVLSVPDSNALLRPLIRVVFNEDIEPSPQFQALGAHNACNILANLVTVVPVAHKTAHRAMLKNAMNLGVLNLDSIPEVQAHREMVKKSAPAIAWDVVFHPKTHQAPTRKFYTSFPELKASTDEYLESLKALVLETNACAHALHKAKVPRDAPERVALHKFAEGDLKLLVERVTGLKMKYLKATADELWGKDGAGQIQLNQSLLSRLIDRDVVNADIAARVSGLIIPLDEEPLRQRVVAMQKCWGGLVQCVSAPEFRDLYDLCGDFELAMMNPDDVANLKVGYEVSCCLAPDGKSPSDMFARLAGGWVLWTVKNPQGHTIAIAWGALNQNSDLVIDFIDERVKFRVPPLGNLLIEQLIAFAPDVAKAIKAPGVWMGPPGWRRLESFEVFKQVGEDVAFRILTPDFLGVPPYLDALNKGREHYVRLM